MIKNNIRHWASNILMSSLNIISSGCLLVKMAAWSRLDDISLITVDLWTGLQRKAIISREGQPISLSSTNIHTFIYPLPPDMPRYTLIHTRRHAVPSAAADSSINLISTKPNNGKSNITDVIFLQAVATDPVSVCVCVCYCIPYVWMPVACLLNACGPYMPCITYCMCHVCLHLVQSVRVRTVTEYYSFRKTGSNWTGWLPEDTWWCSIRLVLQHNIISYFHFFFVLQQCHVTYMVPPKHYVVKKKWDKDHRTQSKLRACASVS